MEIVGKYKGNLIQVWKPESMNKTHNLKCENKYLLIKVP